MRIILSKLNKNLKYLIQHRPNLQNFHKMYSVSSYKNEIITDLKNIFRNAVNSVLPHKIISENVSVSDQNQFNVCKKVYDISNGCYIIGFGKAVLGMATELEKILGHRLKGGILSVPVGTRASVPNSKLEILEGAKNNLPDADAENNTKRIIEYIRQLGSHECLIVLISGGGSALFTLPKPPLTLNQKIDIIRYLASSGADIKEINSVRKLLSLVKGGGLARIAYPRRIISLILSDVINDPLDTIASGPTVLNTVSQAQINEIFEKYHLSEKIPNEVFRESESNSNIPIKDGEFCHVDNFLLGNNEKALKSAASLAKNLGYLTSILSSEIEGDVQDISASYVQLLNVIIEFYNRSHNSKEQFVNNIQEIAIQLKLTGQTINELYEHIKNYRSNTDFKGVCLIMGGETTVLVKGKGVGGRNQQLALNFSLDLESKFKFNDNSFEIFLLCGGTDGIDGPTDAAGAISFTRQYEMAEKMNLNVRDFIENNNSYEYYSRLNNGEFFIKTGHTGTNVMDIHILIISHRDSVNRYSKI